MLQVVKGLGETLVGAYPGRALSFISKKDKLDSPKVYVVYNLFKIFISCDCL